MKTTPHLRAALWLALASTALLSPRLAADDSDPPPPPPPPHHRGQPADLLDPELRLARMTKQLALTNEQQEQLRPILVEQAEAAKKQAEAMKKIEAVLTPEQREKLAAFRAGARGRHPRHEGPPPPDTAE
ncbi:MAG TPA: hypothetical protein VK178_15870 [Opitutaceae bacterium]|nr:hypothetical protein [Opitutaceae bacterium]